MEEEPDGARKGGNNSLQRWQIAAAAVAGILGVALCIVLPREVITLIIISGMVLFAAVFLFAAVLVEFSRARRARGRAAKGGCDVEEK
jgi:high-affinity Fe2+/Pb2+ permease